MQEWDFESSKQFDWRKGTPILSAYSFPLIVKDYIGTQDVDGLTNLEISVGGSDVNYIELIGSTRGNYIAYQNGMSFDLNIKHKPISALLTQGQHTYIINIIIRGTQSNGVKKIIDYKTIIISTRVYSETQSYFTPTILNYEHAAAGGEIATQNITINGAVDWNISLPFDFILDVIIVSGAAQIVENDIFGTIIRSIRGSGIAVIAIKPNRAYASTLAPNSNLYSTSLTFGSNDFNLVNWPLNIYLKVNESVNIIVDKSYLEYYAVKNVTIANALLVNIESFYDFELETPDYIIPSINTGAAGSHQVLFDVVPAQLLNSGIYQGNIKVKYTNSHSEQLVYEIGVKYIIEEYINMPYILNDFNFTLDDKLLTFFSDIPNTYFQVSMKIRAYEFNSTNYKEKIIPFKVPLIKGKQTENIGLKIHRVMERFEEVTLNIGSQYISAEVELQVTEISFENKNIVRGFTIPNIKFIAGVSPYYSDKNVFLESHSGLQRCFSNTKKIVNLLLKSGNHTVIIKVNDQDIKTYTINPGRSNVYRDLINFEELEVKSGDIISYVLIKSTATEEVRYTRLFTIFPESNRKATIFWEDDYKLLQNMDISGVKTLENSYEIKQFKRFKSIVEYTENYQTNKSVILKSNTGYLCRDEHVSIDSLCRSTRAWIYMDKKYVELASATKNIKAIDEEAQLIDFDLELTINKKYNEEIYYGRF